jgi:hypothetical protein
MRNPAGDSPPTAAPRQEHRWEQTCSQPSKPPVGTAHKPRRPGFGRYPHYLYAGPSASVQCTSLDTCPPRHERCAALAPDTSHRGGGANAAAETPRQAAHRELDEETGISAADLRFRARTLFSLGRPDRLEYAAVFSVLLNDLPELRVKAEASDFLWWSPSLHVEEDMSSLDATIALWGAGASPKG